MKETTISYKERLLKTPEQIKTQEIDSAVEQATIAMKMGLLSIESEISKARGKILQKETNVANALKQLEEAKSSPANQLVQKLVDAFQNIKQQSINLKSAEKDLEDLKEIQSFLVKTNQELF